MGVRRVLERADDVEERVAVAQPREVLRREVLRADMTLKPLRQVAAGTRLRILDQTTDWVHVEFDDPQYGRRVGYIQKAFVRIDAGR